MQQFTEFMTTTVFTPETNLKAAIDRLFKEAPTVDTAVCAEIKALYDVYTNTQSDALLQIISLKLCNLLLETRFRAVPSPLITDHLSPDVFRKSIDGFRLFLKRQNLSPSTVDQYVRNFKRIMKENDCIVFDTDALAEKLDSLISELDGNDRKSHNTNINALRQFREYYRSNDAWYTIVSVDERGAEQVCGSCYPTEESAREAFESFRVNVEGGVLMRLYDPSAKVIAEA